MTPRHRARQSGMALVITLALMVLMTFLVVAFLSKAQRARQAEGASAAGAEAGDLVRSAADIIISDLQKEIVAGSDNKGANDNPVYWPKDKDKWSPQSTIDSPSKGASLLVKQSGKKPFFDFGGDPTITGSTGDKTDVPSRNWRTVPAERWDKPRLIADDSLTQAGTFASGIGLPEWINISAEQGLIADAGTNRNPVTGRFAYNVYDLSGLPDITVAGRPEDNTADDVYGAGRIDFAGNGSFETVPGVIKGKWDDYMWWRFQESFALNGTGQGEMDQGFPELSRWAAELGGGPLHPYDPNNATVRAAKEKRLYSRQDLIRYIETGASSQGSPLETDILPFVRTHSASSNAPMWWPENPTDGDFNQNLAPGQDNFDYRGNAEDNNAANRFIPGVTVKSGFTRRDGSEAKPGEPLLKRRFPLSKLELVVTENATQTDARLVESYFGLEWDGGNNRWRYMEFNGGTKIMTLDEVAADGREPNFFELLKAGILSGSLGEYRYSTTNNLETNRFMDIEELDKDPDHQILEIGANIIDQYDIDDIPTIIESTLVIGGERSVACGIESHPYVTNLLRIRTRRRDRDYTNGNNYNPQPWVTAFLRFQMWNPHANAEEEWENPKDPRKNKKNYQYRIIGLSGETQVSMFRYPRRIRIQFPGNRNRIRIVDVAVQGVRDEEAEQLQSTSVPQKGRSITFSGGVDSFARPRVLTTATGQNGTVQASAPTDSKENVYTAGGADIVGMWMGDVRADNNWEITKWTPIIGPNSTSGSYFYTTPAPGTGITVPNPFPDNYYLNDYFSDNSPYNNKTNSGAIPECVVTWDPPAQYELQVDMGDGAGWRTLQRLPPINYDENVSEIQEFRGSIKNRAITVINPLIYPLSSDGNQTIPANRHRAGAGQQWGLWRNTRQIITPARRGFSTDSYTKFDPRTFRFGVFANRAYNGGGLINDKITSTDLCNLSEWAGNNGGFNPPFTMMPYDDIPLRRTSTGINGWAAVGALDGFISGMDWMVHPVDRRYGPVGPEDEDEDDGNNSDGAAARQRGVALGEFVYNSKDRSCWYRERDGTTRLGDWGASVEPNGDAFINPLSGNTTIRPVLLNRPFRSIAEMGYAFRGEPWKSVNFHGNDTADAGLLDLFSVADSDTVKGRINPNKASVNTLRAMIHEAVADVMDYELDDNPGSGGILGPQETDRLALALRQRLDTEPVEQVSQIPAVINEILAQEKDTLPDLALWAVPRTSLARALADNTDLRTWELLIDVIAQAGRFPTALGGNAGPGDFVVEGEDRLWVHVSIDRLTGKVLDTRIETVQE